jgi:hypothetical protein
LTEEEQEALSDKLKLVFVEGWALDTYSANLPFSAALLSYRMTTLRFKFPYNWSGTFSSILPVNEIHLGIREQYAGVLAALAIHEIGHSFGLSESLTNVLRYKFWGKDIGLGSSFAIIDDLVYSPFYDNLLLEKVGDKAFWAKVYESPNDAQERYDKFWNDNMTVTVDGVQEPLVSSSVRNYALAFAYARLGYWDESSHYYAVASDIEWYTGISRDRFIDLSRELAPHFEKAIKHNDQKSIEAVRKFFRIITDYQEARGTLYERHVILPGLFWEILGFIK